MPSQFSETVPGGSVSGTRTVERQAEGLIVEYVLEWSGEEPLKVRLSDRIPSQNVAEFGFHEEHEPPEWTLADGELELGSHLEPGAERTFVLGLVAERGEDLSGDPSEPTLEAVGGAATDDDQGGFFDRARRSLLSGDDRDRETNGDDGGSPTPERWTADEETGDEPAIEPEPSTERANDRPRVDADGGVVDPDADPEREATGSVASALAAELEAGTVAESDLATLREHLDLGRSEPEAVRLEYVQKRLGDFDAYVDAMEDLLAVHGDGDDAIAELEARLDRFADDVEAVGQRQDELAARVDDLSDALDAQSETVESLQVAHEEDVDDVRTEIRRRSEVMCEEFDDLQRSLEGDIDALEAEIETFESIRRTLVDGLQRPDDPVAATTVEDADLDALAETEEIPIVDPLESGRSGPNAGSSDAADEGDSTDATPDIERDVQDTLEAAAASNFSVSGSSAEDAPDDSPSGEATEEPSEDEFVSPDPDEVDVGASEATDVDSTDEGADEPEADGLDEAGAEADNEDAATTDEDDAEPTSDDPGEAEEESIDVPGPEANEAEDPESDAEGENASDEGEEDGDRASSIFEIGDVDSKGSSDEEMPTIDFEDS